jgi:TonB family protein
MTIKARCSSLLLLLSLLAAWAAPSSAQTARKPEGPSGRAAPSDAPKWREFTSAEGRFTVSMPGEPKVSTQRLAPPNENVSMRTHIAETEAEYGVAYAEFPEQVEGTERAEALLAGARDAGVRGVGGRLLEDGEEPFDGHPGRVYSFEFAGGYHMRCRSFVVGRRLYMVTASTYGAKAPDEQSRRASEAAADRFMDSFRLHPAAGGTQGPGLPPGDPKGQTATLAEGEVDRLLKSLPEGSVLNGYCAAKFCRKAEGAEYEFKVLKNPAPAYPAVARAAGASGQIVVRIVADEEGRVVAAQALKGHPLLRRPAELAARNMLVSPVKSKGGSPSKFTGVVVYTFVVR